MCVRVENRHDPRLLLYCNAGEGITGWPDGSRSNTTGKKRCWVLEVIEKHRGTSIPKQKSTPGGGGRENRREKKKYLPDQDSTVRHERGKRTGGLASAADCRIIFDHTLVIMIKGRTGNLKGVSRKSRPTRRELQNAAWEGNKRT